MRLQRTNNPTGRRRTPGVRRLSLPAAERGGSVLIAVLWLMALLWVLGIFFFLFANTEQNSAQHYSDAAKVDNRCGVDPDVLWDWALRQIIVGPGFDEDNDNNPTAGFRDSEQDSALYGFEPISANPFGLGPHAILRHVLGRDLQPYNGAGINLITDATGQPLIDLDHDGVADADQLLLNLNYSAVANGGVSDEMADLTAQRPPMDPGYTSPDINALFLSYFAPDPLDPSTLVLIPSYHRPQYLRDSSGFIDQWDIDPVTARRVFRAHKEHLSTDSSGTPYLRYLQSASLGPDGQPGAAAVDDDGMNGVDDAGEIGSVGTDDVLPFGFTTTDDGLNQVLLDDGIWNPAGSGNYNYDVSAAGFVDGTGTPIREAIWLDLGFPVQECDGKRFKPLFGITIIDADAYLNANLAGNTAGTVLENSIDPSLSRFNRSNQGLSPGELSFHYLFNADPLSVPAANPAWEPYRQFFGINPATINAQVLANMETWFLLHGRGDYDATLAYQGELVGRYGEQSRLATVLSSKIPAQASQPGLSGTDDDGDNSDFTSSGIGNFASNDPRTLTTPTQPLDIRGAGTMVDAGGTGANRPDVGAGPNRWVQYLDYAIDSAFFEYGNAYPNLLAWTPPNSEANSIPFNVDEADEIVLLKNFPGYGLNDSTFSVEEMAALHGSENDPGIKSIPSRLRDLLPITLEESTNSDAIRKQLTTESWERIEFALQESANRPWESDNSMVSGAPNFPPLVSSLTLSDPAQPFRLPVTELLAVFRDETDPTNVGFQRKLDLNRHLIGFKTDVNGKRVPDYRELTPHPALDAPGNGYASPIVAVPYPPTLGTPGAEYWARRDRQEKARDIYVLLYVLCGGVDTNPLATPTPYTAVQLEQMAQFAVNLVDALDSDDVITRFEFDTNLSNGWNLDDNPYAATGDTDRAEVFGVESASLTFSEALVFHALHVDNSGSPQNHNGTPHDDRFNRLFTFLELHNASPLPVTVDTQLPDSTNRRGGHWRIRIETQDLTDPMNVLPDDPSTLNTLTLFTGPIPAGTTYTIGSNVSPPAAAMFADPDRVIIDPLDPTPPLDPLPTVLFVNPTFMPGDMGNFQQIVPRTGTPQLDLSLVPEDTTAPGVVPYRINAGDVLGAVPIPGVWDNVTPAEAGGWFERDDRTIITFVLERRAHLTREAPLVPDVVITGQNEENDNPWVEVDRIKVDRREFNLPNESSSNAVAIQDELNKLQSYERSQPFGFVGALSAGTEADRRYSNIYPVDGSIALNTLNSPNQSTPPASGFTAWMPHFDRHFASIMELLSIPLYGPKDLTAHLILDDAGLNPTIITSSANGMSIQTPPLMDRIRRRIAQEKFLFPDFDQNSATPPAASDNHWHRLFAFVEVPSKLHQGQGVDVSRVPGKINLNTIRNAGVLGAVIDAPLIHDLNLLSTVPGDNGFASGGVRNWWTEFVATRDAVHLPDGSLVGGNGRDPVTGRFVPGVPGTHPFRDLSHVDEENASIEHTLLRRLIGGSPNGQDLDGRGLFEVGAGDGNAGTDNTVDYYMRHRLLSKAANQTTTRSHVYIAYIACDFFEVVEPVAGQRQIGAKLATSPGHRGFFIIDVSDPLGNNAYSPGTATTRGRFDFRKYVKYRRTIE